MFETIKELLVEVANVDRDSVTKDAVLKDDLGIDSLYAVELILELETNFNVQIEWEEIKSLITVDDVVKLIEKKTKNM
ncbi:MAG: acyl carrier protein [Anaeroplasmataceae bacterium]|nr:acyl carrier protein [Anaeroplasmataceae bacterium]MDE5868048.1 acyl carrier protein [Anaeroplasmataceae bacterium]